MRRVVAVATIFGSSLNIAAALTGKDWTEVVAWSVVLLLIIREVVQS